jgi:hypothetical protein
MSTTSGAGTTVRREPAPSTQQAGPRPKTATAAGARPPLAERSREAKQRAAAILEVLAGVRTPLAAAQAVGVSLTRYYLLEEKALAGLVAACEPQPRGPHRNDARRLAELERACARWQRECARQQALVRAAQRTIGLAPPAAPPRDKDHKRRSRRPVVRALQAATRLRAGEEKPKVEASPQVPVPS